MEARLLTSPNNRRPKVALFHYSGPPMVSGVDVMIKDQARLFRLHNYKVEIVAGLARQFRKDIPVHLIRRMNPRHPLVFSVLKELKKGVVSAKYHQLENSLYRSLKEYIISRGIGVCILHNLFTRYYNLALTAALARLVAELPHVKFIAWVHDTVFYDEPATSLSPELGQTYPWSLLVKPVPGLTYVCVSNFLKQNLLAAMAEAHGGRPDKITLIHNVHDIPKFLGLSPMMRVLYEDINGLGSDLIACIPVRAIPRKNLELAIAITRAIIDRGVDFKLLMTANIDYKRVENLEYYQNLKKLVEELGLARQVWFLDEYFQRFKSDKKPAPAIPIPELYLISDFLLMTSKVEGFGLPLLEAGLMRVPIFASDIPSLREIGTTNINYFTFDMTPRQIADFILKSLSKMPQAYFYRKVIKQFSLRTTFQTKIIPLIEAITRR